MNVDINKLAEEFANMPFQLVGIYHYIRKPGMILTGNITDTSPGFVFSFGGKAKIHFNDTPCYASSENVVHGGANMNLDYHVLGNRPWEYYIVQYRIGNVETDEYSFFKTPFELPTGENPRLIQLLRQLRKALNQPGGITDFYAETLFRNFLAEAFFCVRNKINIDTYELFKQVSTYIHKNFSNSLNVYTLAKQNNVNENRLSYVFKKHTDMRPGEYIIAYRLNRAKELLINSQSSITSIAESVGYYDQFHFSRIFKKRFDLSPSKFREKFKNSAWEFQERTIL